MTALAGELGPAVLAAASTAYQSWRATPLDRKANIVDVPSKFAGVPASSTSSDTSTIARAQELLGQLGYDAGPPDGLAGPRTRNAISAFQHDRGLPETGTASRSVIEHLLSATAS